MPVSNAIRLSRNRDQQWILVFKQELNYKQRTTNHTIKLELKLDVNQKKFLSQPLSVQHEKEFMYIISKDHKGRGTVWPSLAFRFRPESDKNSQLKV